MKKLFSTGYSVGLANFWLLVLRVMSGALMLTHGLPKFLKLINGAPIKFSDPLGVGTLISFILVVFAEFFCSIFIIVGLGTRLASIPLIITMGVAAFIIHGDDPFAKKEMAILYLIIFTTLLVFGGGKYSVDKKMGK